MIKHIYVDVGVGSAQWSLQNSGMFSSDHTRSAGLHILLDSNLVFPRFFA
jgi:hypothetical protein